MRRRGRVSPRSDKREEPQSDEIVDARRRRSGDTTEFD